MPWPIYSERFLYTPADGIWYQYTVPAGHRAVIKSIQAANIGTATPEALVYVNDVQAYEAMVPARSSVMSPPLALVVYAGGTIKALAGTGALVVWVSGYLFRDLSGRSAAPGEVVEDAPPPPGYVG